VTWLAYLPQCFCLPNVVVHQGVPKPPLTVLSQGVRRELDLGPEPSQVLGTGSQLVENRLSDERLEGDLGHHDSEVRLVRVEQESRTTQLPSMRQFLANPR